MQRKKDESNIFNRPLLLFLTHKKALEERVLHQSYATTKIFFDTQNETNEQHFSSLY